MDILLIVLSSLAALFALVVPLLATILTSANQRKLVTQNFMYEQKMKAFSKLVDSYNVKRFSFISNISNANAHSYINEITSEISAAIIVANDKTAASLTNLMNAVNDIENKDYEAVHLKLFNECVQLIQKDLRNI